MIRDLYWLTRVAALLMACFYIGTAAMFLLVDGNLDAAGARCGIAACLLFVARGYL